MKNSVFIGLTSLVLLLFSCNKKQEDSTNVKSWDGKTLFEALPSSATGINFKNEVHNTEMFNIFLYRNFYNGGGVAIGDINGDELPDIYFTKNMGTNELYLNKGNMQFENITESAGVGGTKAWSTGVVMVDVNADGKLDLYVCNAGYVEGDDQANELFINQGNKDGKPWFKEMAAEYQLDEKGYTTHAAFFDYDIDGDLDCYILNNSFMPVNTLDYSNKRELYAEDWDVQPFLRGGGDKLLRNDNGKYNDVTRESGIYGSLIGFGLGVTVGDVNGDMYPDMYISNDFFERDYLYINQKDGTFKEEIKQWMQHISMFSMGADMADINNDGYPEIFATDMLPSDDQRLKKTTQFEGYNVHLMKLERDFYYQYMHNTLQLNNRDGSFKEIAQYSGVAASDWSWGALMFDADNDGFRDLFVCNGVYQDVTNQDFVDFFANEVIQRMAMTGKKEDMQTVLDSMPKEPIPNAFFRNKGDLTFEPVEKAWGTDTPSFSNGAAYADLDNDGDLDLVVNNLAAEAFVYRNHTNDKRKDHHYLKVKVQGDALNTHAIGTKITLYQGDSRLMHEVIPSRGFQSSVDYTACFGLGKNPTVDSMQITWPNRTSSMLAVTRVDTTLVVRQTERTATPASSIPLLQQNKTAWFAPLANAPFTAHKENEYYDFFQEALLPRMLSKEGPAVAVGDLNGDKLDDLFIGGGREQPGQVYFQQPGGRFMTSVQPVLAFETGFEDTAAALADLDGDGDLDLVVGSGGNDFPVGHRMLHDRIYLNNGKGIFQTATNELPRNGFNTAVIQPWDYDRDGDMDLFVGSRSVPMNYGIPPIHYLYENDGKGRFTNVTERSAKDMKNIGMVTDATLADMDGDKHPELILVGEWTSPGIWKASGKQITPMKSNLEAYSGWYYGVHATDIDADGDPDLVFANRGENFYYKGSQEAPAKLWVSDFDNNGTVEKITTRFVNGKDVPVAMKKELTDAVVTLKKQNLKHAVYATRSIQDLFGQNLLKQGIVYTGNYFKSAVAINNGKGQFTIKALPAPVQFSTMYGIASLDINKDGHMDLVMAGNDNSFMPQFSKMDASFGEVLFGDGLGGFRCLSNTESGIRLPGEVRDVRIINTPTNPLVLAAVNSGVSQLYTLRSK